MATQAEIWRSNERRRARFEVKFRRPMKNALMSPLNSVLEVLEMGITVNDVTTFVNNDFEGVVDTFGDIYRDTGRAFFTVTYRDLNRRKDAATEAADAFFVDRVSSFLRELGGTKITSINKTLIENANNALADAYALNLTQVQTVKELRKVFNHLTREQAKRIVQTETTAAAGWGSLQGALAIQAENPDVTILKKWITAPTRARTTHIAANGQTVAMNEDFKVGKDSMPSPSLGEVAEENINCRCSIGYEIIR